MQEKLDALFAWLRAGGASFSGLEVREIAPGDRSTFASTDLSEGHVLLEVPRRLMVTESALRETELGRQLVAADVSLSSPFSLFAACLLEELHRPDSKWRAVFDVFPRDFPSMPLFWGESDLALLSDSFVGSDVDAQRYFLTNDDATIREAVPAFQRFSTDEFLYAHSLVSSRTFTFQRDGQRDDGLVPLLDMLNHSSSNNVAWAYEPAADAFRATANRDVRAGEELCVSYGTKSNRRMLLNFGFVLDEPGRAETVLRLSVPADSPRAEAKRLMLLGRDDPSLNKPFLLTPDTSSVSLNEAMSFLRFATASADEMVALTRSRVNPTGISFITPENEARALKALEVACRARRSSIVPTSEYPTTPNARSVAVIRRGEFFVLDTLAEWARTTHLQLTSSSSEVGT